MGVPCSVSFLKHVSTHWVLDKECIFESVFIQSICPYQKYELWKSEKGGKSITKRKIKLMLIESDQFTL